MGRPNLETARIGAEIQCRPETGDVEVGKISRPPLFAIENLMPKPSAITVLRFLAASLALPIIAFAPIVQNTLAELALTPNPDFQTSSNQAPNQASLNQASSEQPVCKVINVDNLPSTPNKFLNIPVGQPYPIDRSLSSATAKASSNPSPITLRTGPGEHYAPASSPFLSAGEALTVTFHAFTRDCHSWYRVENSTGPLGWIAQDNITLLGDTLTR